MSAQPLVFGEVIQSFLDESTNNALKRLIQKIEDDNGIHSEFKYIELDPNTPNSLTTRSKSQSGSINRPFEETFKLLFKEYRIRINSSIFQQVFDEFKKYFEDEKYIQIWSGDKINLVGKSENWARDMSGVPSNNSYLFTDVKDLSLYIDNCRLAVMVNNQNKIYGRAIIWSGLLETHKTEVEVAADIICASGMEFQFYKFFDKNKIAYARYKYVSKGTNSRSFHRGDWEKVILYDGFEYPKVRIYIKDGIQKYIEKISYIDTFTYSDGHDLYNYIERGVNKPVRYEVDSGILFKRFIMITVSPKNKKQAIYVNSSGYGVPVLSGTEEIIFSPPYNDYYLKDDVVTVQFGNQGYRNTYPCHKEFARLEYNFTDKFDRQIKTWSDRNLYNMTDFSDPVKRRLWEYCFSNALLDMRFYGKPRGDGDAPYYGRESSNYADTKFVYHNRSVRFSLWRHTTFSRGDKLKPGGAKTPTVDTEFKFKIKIYPSRVIMKCRNGRGRVQEWRYDDWADFINNCFVNIKHFNNLS